jgi:hypothetical protein
MRPGAGTPEELETLFEDACLVRDRDGLSGLFDDGAVLVCGGGSREARGADIVRAAAALWDRDLAWLGAPRRVLQAGDTALVLGTRAVNVARRGADRRWRYAVFLLDDAQEER